MIGYEHERRFLSLPPHAAAAGRRIRQAYLSAGRPTVRVRESGGEYVLTVKGGASREVEVALDQAHGSALFEMARKHVIEKQRFLLDGWEVDVFAGRLSGLVIAEIELDAPDSQLPPFPPGLHVLREITGERRLSNASLSRLGRRRAAALLAELYEPYR